MPKIAIIASLVWQWTPFMMLILLAGLQSQPREPLEAAKVDGASAWQTFRYLTLPHMRHYLELGDPARLDLHRRRTSTRVFTITSGGPGDRPTCRTRSTRPFFTAHDVGQASAAGVVVVIGSIIIATFALRVVSTLFKEEGVHGHTTADAARPAQQTLAGAHHANSLTLLGLAAWVVGLVFVAPVLWMVLTSLHSEARRSDQSALDRRQADALTATGRS